MFIKRFTVALIGLVMTVMLTACGNSHTHNYPLREISLGTSQDTNGTFFLIAGGVGSHQNAYYYFYVQSADGTVKLHKNSYDDVVLRLVPAGTKPYIRCEGHFNPKAQFSFSAWDTRDDCVFNVPEAAIGHDVDIDIKKVNN